MTTTPSPDLPGPGRNQRTPSLRRGAPLVNGAIMCGRLRPVRLDRPGLTAGLRQRFRQHAACWCGTGRCGSPRRAGDLRDLFGVQSALDEALRDVTSPRRPLRGEFFSAGFSGAPPTRAEHLVEAGPLGGPHQVERLSDSTSHGPATVCSGLRIGRHLVRSVLEFVGDDAELGGGTAEVRELNNQPDLRNTTRSRIETTRSAEKSVGE
jgi:hypothetical protein